MKKAIKTMSKFLAVFLSILFLVEILPTQVMAEAYSAYSAEKQYINDLIDKPAELDDVEKADILYEVTEKRDEHTKVYKRADGTYTALVSQTPLHFMSDGMWKEIDNTLVYKNGALTNADNPFNVTLPERITSNSQITLENDGNEIAFAVNDISASNSKITDKETASTEELEVAAKNTKSEVRYEDVAEDTDIEYIILPNGIKENIIVSEAASIKDTYSFNFEIGNLSYKLNDNNSLDITDVNGDIKFTIPAPVMTDSNLALSYDIGVSVTDNNNGTITLVYSPSKEWTGASERSYPITIDPAILSDSYSDNLFEDTVVYYDSSDSTRANTNYFDDGLVVIGDYTENNTTHKSEVYTRINTELLQNFGNSAIITDAQYVIAGIATGSRMYAKTLTSPVDMETVTYNLKPDTSNLAVIDYYTAPRALGESANDVEFLHFNITKPLNDWLNGAANYGMAVVPDSDFLAMGYINGHFMNSSASSVLILDFMYVNGYNDLYNYHSQDIGRAGTGYVNDYTRSMSLIRNDLSIPGNITPVSIDMVYNPALFDYYTVNSGESAPNICGNNWLPNYYRFVQYVDEMQIHYFTETGSEIDFIAQTGENDEITFVDSHAEYIGDSGYTAEILEAPENYEGAYLDLIQITRPDGYIERFNEYGALISVTNPDYTDQHINIYYTAINGIDCIDYITDGVGRKYDFVYDSTTNLLSEIVCKSASNATIKAGTTNSDLKVSYTYDNDGYLTAVTFADGKSIHYTYDNNGLLTSAENIDGYKVAYTYGADKKVANVTEFALDTSTSDYVSGGSIAYTVLNPTQVQITDSSNNVEVYQFNCNGSLLYTCDNKGNQISSNGSNSNEGYFIIPSFNGVNSTNLLKNGDFESITGWSGSNLVEHYTYADALSGEKVLKVGRATNTTAWKSQTVSVSQAGDYTFSAYVYSDNNSNNTDAALTFTIVALDGSSDEIASETISVNNIDGEWQRYTVTLTAPATVEEIEVSVGLDDSQGTYYIDNAQFEYLGTASEFNLINNGSFTDNGFASSQNFTSGIWYPSDSNDTVIVNDNILGRTVKALKINGSVDGNKTITQKIDIDGSKGDAFSVGAWFKGSFVRSEINSKIVDLLNTMEAGKFNFTGDRYAQIEVSYQYYEEDENQVLQPITVTETVKFEQFISNWQFARNSFALKGGTDQITVVIRYAKNINDAYITDVQLNLDKNASVYFDDVDNEEVSEDTCPCENCEEINCTCNCVDEEHCTCIQCNRRSGVTTEDTFGNILTSTSFDGIYSIIASDAFTSDGNYIASSTNADGNTVSYGYNTLNGILESITDAKNHSTNYAYDAYGLLTSVTALNGNNTSSAAYTYTNDRLTAITHNGFSYNFAYDIWGQLVQVSVGSQPIVSYTYGTGANRSRLTYITYHNNTGSETVFRYIYSNGNVSQIKINGVKKYEFKYDTFGSLIQITHTDSRVVKYTEGRTDILDFNNHYIYSSYTNDDGNLIEKIGGLTYTTTDYDSDYTATTGITVQKSDYAVHDGRVVGTLTSNDWFGRTEQEIVKTESAVDDNPTNNYAAITTSYGYPVYANNKTSDRVSYITNRVTYGTDTATQTKFYGFSYDYDANGNITAEYRRGTSGSNTLLKTYYYDDLNQLVRVNEVGGNTYVYEYDNSGNITSKKEYLYTTDAVILDEPESEYVYSYNATWKDRLDAINNTNFEYDQIGNPTSIGSDTLTWEGRTLKSYTKGNETYNCSYDENGLRHRKTVSVNNAVTETYNYVWSDGKLISQEYSDGNTSYAAKFVYGSNGVVQGFIYDDTTYLYVRNLQGDIVAIVDGLGREAMKMSYDAWGCIGYSVGSLNNTTLFNIIKHLSPFTYRGYCYDTEMSIYYLQSRYYSPAIGRFINTDDTRIAVVTQGSVLGANLFAYCENDPISNCDYNGFIKVVSPGIRSNTKLNLGYLCANLFIWGFTHKTPNASYDFSTLYGTLIAKRMKDSTIYSSYVEERIEEVYRSSKKFLIFGNIFNFYKGRKKTSITDWDLALSIGGGGKILTAIVKESVKKSGKKTIITYKIVCALINEYFDFNSWKDHSHSDERTISILNSVGEFSQKYASFTPYYWGFVVEYRIKKTYK